jgi:hypothetical protein
MNPETAPCQKVNVGPRFSFCSMLPNPSANLVISPQTYQTVEIVRNMICLKIGLAPCF